MAWRFWLTSGFAAVLAAMAQAPAVAADDDVVISRASRHSVAQTAERLKDCAREHGLPLFAAVPAPGTSMGAASSQVLVIVLGCSVDQTPAAQSLDDGAIELPLALRVAPLEDGGAEVRFVDQRWVVARPEAPDEVGAMLRQVERIVDAALG